MTPANKTPDAVHSLREKLNVLTAKRNTIAEKIAALNERLQQIQRASVNALADGDDGRAATLRGERAVLEAELPNLAAAEVIASRRVDEAQRELAQAEYPMRLVELQSAASDVRRLLGQLQIAGRRFLESRSIANTVFGAAGLGDRQSPDYPLHVKIGPFGAQIVEMLATADLSGAG
jgi:chromosome segregation ATPase